MSGCSEGVDPGSVQDENKKPQNTDHRRAFFRATFLGATFFLAIRGLALALAPFR